MPGHIVKSFDQDLDAIRGAIAQMGTQAASQLSLALNGLFERNGCALDRVLALDHDINVLQHQLDGTVIRLLALRQPMAEDLRLVVAALRMARGLERMGDYAKNIAKHGLSVLRCSAPGRAEPLRIIHGIGFGVERMVVEAVQAFSDGDAVLARKVRRSDEQVDTLHTQLFEEVMGRIGQMAPEAAQSHVHLLFIARSLERIGDHATDIAEDVIFLIEGTLPADDRQKLDASALVVVGECMGG